MYVPPFMDSPIFGSGFKATGSPTFSIAIASPFPIIFGTSVPVRAAPAICSRLVDCLRLPLTSAGHPDRHGSAGAPLRLLLFPREKVASPNALIVVGEDLAQVCAIIARSALECRKFELCSYLDRVCLSLSRLCRRTPSPCPDCPADTWLPTFYLAEYICPWT